MWRQKPRAVRLIYTKSNIIIVPKVSPRATAQHTDDQRSLRSRPTSSQLNFQRCPSGGDLHSEPLREGGHGHGQPTGGGSTSEDRRSSSVLRADSASGLKASGDLTLASIICMRVRACAKRTTMNRRAGICHGRTHPNSTGLRRTRAPPCTHTRPHGRCRRR